MEGFGLILAAALVPTVLIYFIGSLFLKRLQLTGATIAIGFFCAWVVAALGALMVSSQFATASAVELVAPASLAGSIAALIGVALLGERKPDSSNAGDQ